MMGKIKIIYVKSRIDFETADTQNFNFSIEVPENATEAEIEKEVYDEINTHIEGLMSINVDISDVKDF